MSTLSSLKIALVHDQLADFGGGERVLLALKEAFPQADLFTSFIDTKKLGSGASHFALWHIFQSWARHIPFITVLYSPLRFLLPYIWRSFDLSSYDVVICSSAWGMCKGVSLQRRKMYKRKPLYVCYLHTPPRYLYGYDESSLRKYLPVRIYALIVNHFLRSYDYESSQSIDYFIFNAQEVRKRSLKFYKRDGIVIHPPITLSNLPHTQSSKGEYFLTVSRLVPTKHIDVLIRAANEGGFNLKVVGAGKELQSLQAIAGPSVEFLGAIPDTDRDTLYTGAKAFLYASKDEDFGMVPVEAMAHGTPVIAYASGGVLETVKDGVNGYLYSELEPSAVVARVRALEALNANQYDAMREHARTFAKALSTEAFIKNIQEQIASHLLQQSQ